VSAANSIAAASRWFALRILTIGRARIVLFMVELERQNANAKVPQPCLLAI
jgi:hypothetical protein